MLVVDVARSDGGSGGILGRQQRRQQQRNQGIREMETGPNGRRETERVNREQGERAEQPSTVEPEEMSRVS
jgi:hypothetical protein